MSDERKSWNLYDIALIAVPLVMVALGIFYLRAPKVAILNYERVAIETGVADRLRESETQLASAMYARLNELTVKMRAKNTDFEAKLAAASGDAAKKLVQEDMKRANTDAQAVAEQVKQEFQQFREDARRDIRAKIDPFISRLAHSRRFDLVIDSGDGRTVFYYRPNVDITDEIIKKCGSELAKLDLGPARVPVSKPAQQASKNRPQVDKTSVDKTPKK